MKKDFSYDEATIAAIATPIGPGAIGVVKVSGDLCEKILERIFVPKKPLTKVQSHRLYYGFIQNPQTKEKIDEVLVTLMKAPHTYTREDVLEIYTHSGYLILAKVLETVLQEGARLAEPGEFTKRAFLNGRLDLSQAEAVLELIEARSEEGLKLALNQLQGKMAQELSSIREVLLSALAVIEVAVDFPEEDVELISQYELAEQLEREVINPLQKMIQSYKEGKIYREGISVVIAGRPNVGKSSLMNALLKEERAIVTPIPGTTRDIIEETATIKGLPVRLIDTAGLRETSDLVEEIGVKKAKEKISQADIVIFLVDSSLNPTDEDWSLYKEIEPLLHLVAINKIDIASESSIKKWKALFPEEVISISAKEHRGIDKLTEKIFFKIMGKGKTTFPQIAPNLRQKIALEKTLKAVSRVVCLLKNSSIYPELIAVDLREALDHLGEITGEATTEDLLDKIFNRFCIGK